MKCYFGSPSTRRQRTGFTLIELLVVIAIIAILAAILFPVFGRARENARRASCQSNQKQIMLGVMQYAQDSDERYPLTWTDGLNIIWPQAIHPYLNSTQVFVCPSDKYKVVPPWSAAVYDGQPMWHTSYIANIQMGGWSAANSVSMASVVSSATTVYLTDGARGATTAGAVSADPTGLTWPDDRDFAFFLATPGHSQFGNGYSGNPNARHLEMVNVAFVDGHVKALRNEKFYVAPYPFLDPATGG